MMFTRPSDVPYHANPQPSPRYDTEWTTPGAKELSFFKFGIDEPFDVGTAEPPAFEKIVGRLKKTAADTNGRLRRGERFYAQRAVIYIINENNDLDLSWVRDGTFELLYQGWRFIKTPLDLAVSLSKRAPCDIEHFEENGACLSIGNQAALLECHSAFEVKLCVETPFRDYVKLRCLISGHLLTNMQQ